MLSLNTEMFETPLNLQAISYQTSENNLYDQDFVIIYIMDHQYDYKLTRRSYSLHS